MMDFFLILKSIKDMHVKRNCQNKVKGEKVSGEVREEDKSHLCCELSAR